MITIFFIAFEFPPSNNGGVFRPLGFAKYLPEFGIKPVIFTLHPDSIPIFFQKNITDHTLAKDIPAETEVVYIPINKIQKKSKLKEFFEIRDRNTDSWELLAERILIKSIKKY